MQLPAGNRETCGYQMVADQFPGLHDHTSMLQLWLDFTLPLALW